MDKGPITQSNTHPYLSAGIGMLHAVAGFAKFASLLGPVLPFAPLVAKITELTATGLSTILERVLAWKESRKESNSAVQQNDDGSLAPRPFNTCQVSCERPTSKSPEVPPVNTEACHLSNDTTSTPDPGTPRPR